ncbi:MAG: fatty acid--CoA ligase [Rhodocyclaceae bacterium]|nr:fatty acid--CoA ligase [Rhodocyclaceae bacterium]
MIESNIVVTPSAYDYPLLIKQLLHTPMATAGEQEIVYSDRQRMRYADLFERIGRLANLLGRLGVARGDTVAMMDWDSHRYLESFFAVPMYGAVLQTVNIRLSPEQIAYTLNDAGASVVLVNAEFLPLLMQIRGELRTVRLFVLIADDPVELPGDFEGEYEALLKACPAQFDFPDLDENTRATTFYTTGTTGNPKGVYFSHRQLVLHTLAVSSALATAPSQGRFHRGDVYMPMTPMFHVHAWGIPYVATMMGVKQVYPGRYLPDHLLKLKVTERVTFSHCVPTILMMLLDAPSAAKTDLGGWKMVIGGAALPASLAQRALDRGIDVFTGYGMSETCPILTLAQVPPEAPADQTNLDIRLKTGRPVPLVDLKTVDVRMQPLARDGRAVGEVVVRAPWLTQGYLHKPEASEQLWAGGYLHTQDIGTIDPAGFLQVTDRIKDVIKTGGEWVSSLELEDIIGRCPGVAEVAVIGVPDARWGERPAALVVVKAGATVDEASVRAEVEKAVEAGQISRYAMPERVRFVDALDRTSVGKINKRALRERFA